MQPKLRASDPAIYAFARPFPDENGVVVMNFSNETKNSFIVLQLQEWAEFSSGLPFGEEIYRNNLYENTSSVFTVSGSDTLNFSLPPYGVAVYSISTIEKHVKLPGIGVLQNTPDAKPGQFRLWPNYPNPFNPRTTIQYSVPETTHIKLAVYNALGQQIALLVDEEKKPGTYQKVFDSQNFAGGIYLYSMQGQEFTETRKMVLLR
ncbi:MAG: T9SS type A sorting domain-containing protein [Actinobacteria bacterium]|nr:T9SS type A sorting domain-containing protein [Actinomycetota bacterium]